MQVHVLAYQITLEILTKDADPNVFLTLTVPQTKRALETNARTRVLERADKMQNVRQSTIYPPAYA